MGHNAKRYANGLWFGNRSKNAVLTDSPVARSAGPRILFLLGAAVTVAILMVGSPGTELEFAL